MSDHVYRVTEIVGSSPDGVDQAVRNAIARASQTLRNLDWFEVVKVEITHHVMSIGRVRRQRDRLFGQLLRLGAPFIRRRPPANGARFRSRKRKRCTRREMFRVERNDGLELIGVSVLRELLM